MAKRGRGRPKGSGKVTVTATRVFSGDDLRAVVAEIEAAMDDMNEAADALKAIKKNALARGYSLKALRRVIGEHRAKDPRKVEEERAIEELYRQALDLTPMEEIMQAGGDDADDEADDDADAPPVPARNGATAGAPAA